MRDQQMALLLAFVALLASGCRKDKDGSPPSISIILPVAGTTIAVPDTLLVQVEVNDDHVVGSVHISLADVNGVPIAPPVTVQVGSPSAIVTRDLVVLDERIPSGTYTLTVRATDGNNERKAFRSITVQAAALRLRSLFVAPPAGTGPSVVTRIDSTGELSTWTTMTDLHGATIDGYTQHLFLAGGQSAPLIASSTSGISIPWQLANINATGSPYFNGPRVDPADGRFYISTNDGSISGFTGEGFQTFTSNAMQGFYSESTCIVGDLILSVQRNISQPLYEITTLALVSGQEIVHFPLDVDTVLHMDRRTEEQVLVFGNRNGLGVIQERNAYQGSVFEMREFNEGLISDVIRLDEQTWIIALPDGLVRFTYQSNSVMTVSSIPGVKALAIDQANGVLYAGVGNQLHLLDPANGNIVGNIVCPDPVGYILLLFNR